MQYFTILIAILFSVGCIGEDSDKYTLIDQTEEDTQYYFDTHFVGLISDDNGDIISNAKVTIGTNTATSSINGIFLFKNTKTNTEGQVITVEAAGYDTHIEYVTKLENQISNHHIVLRQQAQSYQINPTFAQTLQLDDAVSLDVVENAFIDKNGNLPSTNIKLKITKNPLQQDLPFISTSLKKGILDDGSTYILEAYDSNDNPLKLKKALTVHIMPDNIRFGALDIERSKWVEVSANNNEGNRFLITKLTPIIYGKYYELAKIETKLIDIQGIGISVMNVQLLKDNNQINKYTSDQDGNLIFYTKSPANIDIQVLGGCQNILMYKSQSIEGSSTLKLENITIQEDHFKRINSSIKNCSFPITALDMVNVKFDEAQRSIVVFQTGSDKTFNIPFCNDVSKAEYFKSDNKLFTVNLSKPQSGTPITIKTDPFCVDSYSGSLQISGQKKYYNQSEFYIIKDKNETTLKVTDLTTFNIVIPFQTISETSPVIEFFSTFPKEEFCSNANCNDLTARLIFMDTQNTFAKVSISGMVNGVEVSGTFEKKIQ